MADQRVAGLLELKVDGEIFSAKGSFSYNLGRPKRETVVGSDAVHGYKEMPQPAYLEGAITDRGNLDLKALVDGRDKTVSLTLGNGKMIVLRDAWFTGDGTVTTEEGEISVRWESGDAEEVS